MRFITLFIFTIIFTLSTFAQTAMQPLATISGRSFTAQDLSPDVGKAWINLPETLAKARRELLNQQIEDVLFSIEASNNKLTVDELIKKDIFSKVPNPTEAEVKKTYDANRASIGNTPLAEIRPQIVAFLRKEPEKKAFASYVESLKEKHKIVFDKDVNAPDLAASDVLATVGGRTITHAAYFRKNGLKLYEYKANTFDSMQRSLEQLVDSALYASEAQSMQIATSDYIAREITNKLKTYTDEETELVQDELRKKLYPKYRVRYFVNEPTPFIQAVSADDDPFLGKADAPVTVIMFTDFQCPSCATVYPILKQVTGKYGDQVRLVIRDFPLEQIHENAFQAAVAANIANKKGKFFEFKELLYKNQDSLDTETLKRIAGEVGLNVKKFERDLNDQELANEIRKDIADGRKYGVTGTPSIFVNGYKIRSLSIESFKKAIERALKK